MAYFLPSFFQKRLLRYALSRLELVDTEALDLDSLGIRWGQRSTVELRDIGLRIEKLATLLHLPPSSQLLSARVRFLKITVPADIYSSGIICEASGIDVHLRLPSEDTNQDGKPAGLGIHPSGAHGSSGDQILPTPNDLAQSFLQAEPKEEKDELQAAISSRSQVLHRSGTSSSDDEEEYGLGDESMSLPSFVAGFLKGIAERLQVKVNNISIRVDMEVKQDGTSKRQPEDKPDLISGLLTVREVSVDAVSNSTRPGEVPPHREGKRLISLSDINLALVSDPVVFSNYSRFVTPQSPSTTMQSKGSQPPSRASSPPPLDSPQSNSVLAMTRSTIFGPPRDTAGSQDPEDAEYPKESEYPEYPERPEDPEELEESRHELQHHEVPEMEASNYTGRFSDADTDAENRSEGYLEDSRAFFDDDKILDNPEYLDSVIESHIDDVEHSGMLPPQEYPHTSHHNSPHQSPNFHAARNATNDRDTGDSGILRSGDGSGQESDTRTSQHSSQATLEADHHTLFTRTESPKPFPEAADSPLAKSAEIRPLSRTSSPPSEAGSTSSHSESSNEDLSESKMFSNEEAQSMYMSAISQGSSRGFMPNIPGAWDSPESTHVFRNDSFQDNYASATYHSQAGHTDDDNDETTISTPKLTAQTGPHITQEHNLDESPSTGRDRSQTPPPLNKIIEVSKKFFSVDKIQIWLPPIDSGGSRDTAQSASSGMKESTANLQESMIGEDLLASKTSASTRFRGDSIDSSVYPENLGQRHPRHPEKDNHHDFKNEHRDIGIEIHSAELHLDIATGWLLTKIGQRLLDAFGDSGEEPLKKSHPLKETQGRQAFSLALDKFSIKFVEHIPGHAYPAENSQIHPSPSFRSFLEDVLLHITLSGLNSNFAAENGITKLRLDVSKFVLGFASEDLLSFDEGLKMRESTRDILSPTHGDISVSLTKSTDSARVNFTTLPLQINFNIQRLEEVVGWIGGLSTILELGSSISSVSTAKGAKKDPPKRPRGVHFEAAPPPAAATQNDSVMWKVNARLGGIVLDVLGETHCLKLRTTAVKVVSRFEGVGVQIDKAKLSGPFPLDDDQDTPAKITLSNIRVEFLFTPKEVDLDRLLSLITPSKDKYDEDDDIMLDTLFRQRRQGSVLRVTVAGMKTVVSHIGGLEPLSQLGNELGRLSNVTKYLPEDDRPGILTLTLIREFDCHVHVGGKIGDISTHITNAEAAYIPIPSLIAAQIGTVSATRNDDEELLGEVLPASRMQSPGQVHLPMLMTRFIADEMDPTIKIKLYNLRVEYSIPSVIAFLGLSEDMSRGDMASNMAKSLANLADLQDSEHEEPQMSERSSEHPESPKAPVKPTKLALIMRDCVIGLNPRNTPAKGLVVLTSAKFSGAIHSHESSEATLDLRKASIMIIDDVQNVGLADNVHPLKSSVAQSNQVQTLIDLGYVPVSSISSATAIVKLMQLNDDGTKSVDVELRDDLLILETCADSTQTLINILNGLQPPTPPSPTLKYRTEVMPLQDMLASFSGDAFSADQTPHPESSPESPSASGQTYSGEGPIDDELEYVSDFYTPRQVSGHEAPTGNMDSPSSDSNDLLDSFHSQYHVSSSFSEFDFRDDHFAKQSAVGGTAHRWDSTQNTYGLSNDHKLQRSPLRIRVRDAHVIWNLFDGYDWQRTRDTISKAVKEVEKKATERRARTGSRASPGVEDEEESVIGDCLFNSIYIGIPAHKDPRELRNDINRNIDDLVSETGSYATTTTVTGATPRQGQSPSYRGKRLRLSRSKYHKMTFELKGICADFVVFPPDSGETQSSLDVRVNDLEIFDHVPTSTWKKFATYMHEMGEKESGTSMVHLEVLTVRPVPDLAASEIVLKATLLPLRLHVDQDALDFICRFFEFRDESAPAAAPSAPGEAPFLQRVEINAVPVKLDFKPKRVDYAGLQSGRTTEFMNFFVLDGADMVMRHVIIYGVSGFDKLGNTLNDIWMPDIKRNQLPGVLAGLAPIRSLVNVGGGVKDLVVVPMREYQKDGRIVRSIQKGALAFAKTTSNELVKLGAKLAIGTQTVLQGAEDLLTTPSAQLVGPEEDSIDEEEAKKISLYADQPVGVVQGLRGAFTGLERDLLLARDAIVAVPGEVVESGSAKAAARAVWKRAPTVVLRPAIGVSKAVGKTLLGAGNTLDPSNRRKMEDKYKRH
ncbi:hypothetical protein ASPWEDRAFT_166338 [Aspergillus wentii DTO 134E9]|uniref:Autophagy-related protein 2 n=1 Tax=Aspergillus wentii DTO 134E9 TaxID=1073089 RepID=A0A1L9RZ68_ASPWE|nr:uncharacterized protein ASPWEDRAFT_166338 [Aspergillus wentii DTO 134E9]KAI9932683.1 autophagy- protein 2 [Aspergillus wentii]OJJ40256.1 hypothetical protein ASPWEDRAFT_166338 [Aspergillus wentii DTO 134E9]